jgi:hypothetical protein
MTDNPGVTLDWDLWCSKHLEPLRAEWPKGAAMAMMGLFNAAVNNERIIKTADADARNLTSALILHAPICCLVGDENMHLVIGYAKNGQIFNGKDGPMAPKGGDAQ